MSLQIAIQNATNDVLDREQADGDAALVAAFLPASLQPGQTAQFSAPLLGHDASPLPPHSARQRQQHNNYNLNLKINAGRANNTSENSDASDASSSRGNTLASPPTPSRSAASSYLGRIDSVAGLDEPWAGVGRISFRVRSSEGPHTVSETGRHRRSGSVSSSVSASNVASSGGGSGLFGSALTGDSLSGSQHQQLQQQQQQQQQQEMQFAHRRASSRDQGWGDRSVTTSVSGGLLGSRAFSLLTGSGATHEVHSAGPRRKASHALELAGGGASDDGIVISLLWKWRERLVDDASTKTVLEVIGLPSVDQHVPSSGEILPFDNNGDEVQLYKAEWFPPDPRAAGGLVPSVLTFVVSPQTLADLRAEQEAETRQERFIAYKRVLSQTLTLRSLAEDARHVAAATVRDRPNARLPKINDAVVELARARALLNDAVRRREHALERHARAVDGATRWRENIDRIKLELEHAQQQLSQTLEARQRLPKDHTSSERSFLSSARRLVHNRRELVSEVLSFYQLNPASESEFNLVNLRMPSRALDWPRMGHVLCATALGYVVHLVLITAQYCGLEHALPCGLEYRGAHSVIWRRMDGRRKRLFQSDGGNGVDADQSMDTTLHASLGDQRDFVDSNNTDASTSTADGLLEAISLLNGTVWELRFLMEAMFDILSSTAATVDQGDESDTLRNLQAALRAPRAALSFDVDSGQSAHNSQNAAEGAGTTIASPAISSFARATHVPQSSEDGNDVTEDESSASPDLLLHGFTLVDDDKNTS